MKTKEPVMTKDKGHRLFIGLYPCGVVYADRWVERHGDYKRLAFLSYATLKLDVEKDCPPELAEQIRTDARRIQDKRGENYVITGSGQTVLLGSDPLYFSIVRKGQDTIHHSDKNVEHAAAYIRKHNFYPCVLLYEKPEDPGLVWRWIFNEAGRAWPKPYENDMHDYD